MEISDFISSLPVTTRERDSKIKDALDSGKVYISLINKNNKKHFKIYFKDGDSIKTKQLKVTDTSMSYILKNKDIISFSESAAKYFD